MREIKLIKIGPVNNGIRYDDGKSTISYLNVNRSKLDNIYIEDNFNSIFNNSSFPFIRGEVINYDYTYNPNNIYSSVDWDEETIKNGKIDDDFSIEIDGVFAFSDKHWRTSKIKYIISDNLFITFNSVYLIYDDTIVRDSKLAKLGI